VGIKGRFTDSGISKFIANKIEKINKAIIDSLKQIGKTAVKNAIQSGDYRDITGNLRSSIGCIILRDSQVIFDYFPKAGKGTEGEKGLRAGRQLAQELIADFPKGIVLIVVVGENYAAAVENKGKNVLTGSSLLAKKELEKAFKDLENRFNHG